MHTTCLLGVAERVPGEDVDDHDAEKLMREPAQVPAQGAVKRVRKRFQLYTKHGWIV
jgi:hypothetical protein